jgi:hypothetical protein
MGERGSCPLMNRHAWRGPATIDPVHQQSSLSGAGGVPRVCSLERNCGWNDIERLDGEATDAPVGLEGADSPNRQHIVNKRRHPSVLESALDRGL